MSSPKYFVAAGRSLELCDAFWAERERALAEIEALKAEIGASRIYFRGPYFDSVAFAGSPPDQTAWRVKVDSYAVPNTRSKAGKAMKARCEAVRPPDLGGLNDALIGDHVQIGEGPGGSIRVGGITLHRFGAEFVIEVPAGRAPWGSEIHDPPDAIPLPASEYWRRVEARDADKGAT